MMMMMTTILQLFTFRTYLDIAALHDAMQRYLYTCEK